MVFKREWESNSLPHRWSGRQQMEETAHKPKIIPSSQADPAPSPRNQIMLSSTNLWCISKLISHCTYSELMVQGIGVSGGHIPTISISDSCTITILAQYRYSLYKSIYKFSAAFVFFSSLSTFFFLILHPLIAFWVKFPILPGLQGFSRLW